VAAKNPAFWDSDRAAIVSPVQERGTWGVYRRDKSFSMTDTDPFNLARFVAAQTPVFATVLDELRAGRKRTHWMWFVFPQLRGLGRSPMADYYGIGSPAEARAYLAHPLLGRRLTACTAIVLASDAQSIRQIFGSPDEMKFASSMTLFALATGTEGSVFESSLAIAALFTLRHSISLLGK
jgi:uncharacterized protein (DUF1810 family)